jgi:hypothetical protein
MCHLLYKEVKAITATRWTRYLSLFKINRQEKQNTQGTFHFKILTEKFALCYVQKLSEELGNTPLIN